MLETWQEIWTWDEKNLRTYTGDFEVYDEQAENPENAQVTVYVAVDRKNKACKTNTISFKMKTNGISFLFGWKR